MSPHLAVLQERSVVTHFQPIVSIKKHAPVGLEALSRGLDQGVSLPPLQLFEAARGSGHEAELDALCRECALQQFAAIPKRPQGLMLFVNVQAEQLAAGRFSAAALQRLVHEQGLQTRDIALELSAQDAVRTPGLRAMVETLQGFGFTLAIEDLGPSAHELELLPLLKPDLIKADQALTARAEKDPVKQEQLRAVFALGHRQGALCVAERIETEEQAALALDLGADLLQGHLFGRPQAPKLLNPALVQAAVDRSAERYKAALAGRLQSRGRENLRHQELLQKLTAALAAKEPSGFEPVLKAFVQGNAGLECLYVLDKLGRQISDTVAWSAQKPGRPASLFAAAAPGTDHSLKDYYLGLQLSGQDRCISEPYVSLASGNLCRTLTARFSHAGGGEAILCVDMRSF